MEKDLRPKVNSATTAASDAATKKTEIDGFVKTIQDLYDAATAGSLNDLAADAEKKIEDANKLMESITSIDSSSTELSGKISDAVKTASGHSKAAGGAHDTAKSLHDAINAEFSPNGILLNLEEAKKLESTVNDASEGV